MSHLDPIAYTYDADVHCSDCAMERFGQCIAHQSISCCVTDSEGNEPGAIAPWDEWWEPSESGRQSLVCTDCGEVIATTDEDEDEDEDEPTSPTPPIVPMHEDPVYRQHMTDAGRGRLLR